MGTHDRSAKDADAKSAEEKTVDRRPVADTGDERATAPGDATGPNERMSPAGDAVPGEPGGGGGVTPDSPRDAGQKPKP